MQGNRKTVLFLIPHQDDELLTLGIESLRCNRNSESNAQIYLFTDGSRSIVRTQLCNKKRCIWHKGKHNYELSDNDFIEARDREFIGSCLRLGFNLDCIHILNNRKTDNCLDVAIAENMCKLLLNDYFDTGISSDKIAIRTISPFGGSKQHQDHKALGFAALSLLQKKYVAEVELFQEPYCTEAFVKEYNEEFIVKEYADSSEKLIVKDIVKNVYKKFDPDNGYFAIGYHSVGYFLKKYANHPCSNKVNFQKMNYVLPQKSVIGVD